MKKCISLALACLTIFSTGALASSPSLDNFTKVNIYNIGVYSDVEESMWYTPGMITSYEYGLLTGNENGEFELESNITVAETLAIASRLHSICSTGSENFVEGNIWYQVYVDYMVNNNLISSRQFSDYTEIVTRTEFVGILYYSLYYALGEDVFQNVNNITSIPDVKEGDYYYNAIYALYDAGVLIGNDELGTFAPTSNISRAEAATVVGRMIDESMRIK